MIQYNLASKPKRLPSAYKGCGQKILRFKVLKLKNVNNNNNFI